MAGLFILAPAAALAQGGPDAGGHIWNTTTYDFVVLDPASSGSGTALALTTSDQEFDVTLPWQFAFYGNSYSTITVGENGAIAMGGGANLFNGNGSLPDTSTDSADIAVFWDSLDAWDSGASAAVGGIFTYDDTANSRFIVSWENVGYSSDNTPGGSFQVHLMADGTMSFHYADTDFGGSGDFGASATVGIQDFTNGTADQGNALEISYNTASITDGVTAYGISFCADGDVDGFYDIACGGDDCDDAAAAINPAAAETCNDGIDQDCSGADSVDDFDADGGINTDCGGDDCNDLDATINAATAEVCDDSIDNDCDATTPDIFDADADTYDCDDDCDDSDAAVNAGATEVCSDGIDNDCDGIPLLSDTDLDGDIAIACGGTDCDDFDASLNTLTDADGDGFDSCSDCDDTSAVSLPGGTEVCDGLDNDCDGIGAGVAEFGGTNSTSMFGPGSNRGRGGIWAITSTTILNSVGARLDVPVGSDVVFAVYAGPATGVATGPSDFSLMATATYTSAADGLMDRMVDIGVTLDAGFDYGFMYYWTDSVGYGYTSGTSFPIVAPFGGQYTSVFDSSNSSPPAVGSGSTSSTHYSLILGVGDELADADADGVTACLGDCIDSDATVNPSAVEVCDTLDNNCDGNTDDVDLDIDGEVDEACGGTDCNDADAAINTAATEVCDGVDGDCDGLDDTMDTDLGPPIVANAPETQSSTPGAGISDSNPTTTDTVTFATVGAVTDINVSVDITHTWDGDIDIVLTAPSGNSVTLADRIGGSANDYTGTTFDDEATGPITASSPPYTGTFQPQNALSALDGESVAGTWSLSITDYAGGDNGTLNSWSVTIESGSGGADIDFDGFIDNSLCATIDADCDDTDATIYPGALEICGDSIDQDCDGVDTTGDVDTDTYASVECGGTDCDDNNILVFDGSDNDGDSALGCQDDCDDTNAAVGPFATEVCSDGIDNDCDGIAFEGADVDLDGETDCTDCDDNDPLINSAATEVCGDGIDNNCSGTADDLDVDLDGGISGDCNGDDCDDADATAFVGNTEVCDGVDNDCDGLEDGADFDLDTTVVAAAPETVASTPGTTIDSSTPAITEALTFAGTGYVTDVTVTIDITHEWDGDLNISLISPTGTSVDLSSGNGGSSDDYTATVFSDSAATSITSGSAPFTGTFQPEEPLSGFYGELVTGDWTLDVTDTFPSGDDGVLNSVSVTIESSVGLSTADVDQDGWMGSAICAVGPSDCDDADATINPDAFDICGDTIDQDCDGADAAGDVDADTFIAEACGGDDCDDADATVNPDAIEVCNDAIDNDCDATTDDIVDDDGDGVDCDTDCDDTNALAYPGFPFDICNDGVDNDCDVTTLDLADLDNDGVSCDQDCDDTNPIISPLAPEILCSGLDEDCDQGAVTPDVDDGDGDGFNCDVDCTDTDPAINPAAVEVACDAIDNDCDATTDGEVDVDLDGVTCGYDCDDNDATAFPGNPEVCNDAVDNDCDATTVDDFDNDGDGVTCVTDCDDDDPLSNPFAPEICGDGIDQDCDTMVDEPVDDAYAMTDDDAVLIGLCNFDFPFCGTDWDEVYVQSNGRVTFGFSSTEHTESAALFLDEAPEIAAFWNDLDPAAGGTVSVEEVADTGAGASLVVRWTDVPELGVAGSANTAVLTLFDDGTANLAIGDLTMSDGLVGYSCDGTGMVVETDISDYELLPNAWAVGMGTETALYELFNDQGNTNDLDNTVVDLCLTGGTDADADGWTDVCGDCDDSSAAVFPGADEVCGDSLDNDCNGIADDADLDLDGEIDAACGGDDCNDADDTINTSATEICNGIDDDCSGAPEDGGEDADADGFLICDGDCDDSDATINPDAVEVCDQVDNDCDGVDDNGFSPDADNDGVIADDCGGDDCDDTNDLVFPGADEICDLADNDCNGETDEIDADGDTYLDANCGGDDCDDTNAEVNPGATEVAYDGLDNDCVDGDLVDGDGDGFFGGDAGADCDDSDAAINPAAEEICDDGIDNNCDGGMDDFDRDSDVPADVTCNVGACADCNSSLSGDGAPSALMLFLGLAGLLGMRRRRVL